ncbi:MAG: hypothetical protein NC548_34630 [Lachnospiraceae bacterium]|nr:hypothetical protein [Lachnospiraceae bacterium]
MIDYEMLVSIAGIDGLSEVVLFSGTYSQAHSFPIAYRDLYRTSPYEYPYLDAHRLVYPYHRYFTHY